MLHWPLVRGDLPSALRGRWRTPLGTRPGESAGSGRVGLQRGPCLGLVVASFLPSFILVY